MLYSELLKMGNCYSWFFSENLREFVNIEPISKESENRIFKSKRLSAPIKDNKIDVKRGFDKFSKNEANMELLSRQATTVSKKDMMKTLTKWKKELKLDPSDYDDLKELFEVAKTNHWPQHLLDLDSNLWETTQQNYASTNLLYFYVSRTDADSDAQTFDIAICHLITTEIGIYQDVLIGGLCKKGLLLKDDDDNVFLNFH